MESAVIYGLTACLKGEITIAGGKVEQSNFDNYPILRIDECPEIDVHIVDSRESPSGIGEPGVPPVAPAVANAVFALTGKPVRSLPIRL
jgi:CO/xanthine dehydrogenase Mo-binding subunit